MRACARFSFFIFLIIFERDMKQVWRRVNNAYSLRAKDCFSSVLFSYCFQVGCRYDNQICVFGKEFHEKISTQKYFVVS